MPAGVPRLWGLTHATTFLPAPLSASRLNYRSCHARTPQPIKLRHPFSFYLAHCAAFAKLKVLPQVCVVAAPCGAFLPPAIGATCGGVCLQPCAPAL